MLYLLHLEADGLLDLVHFVDQTLRVSDQCGELARLTESRAQQTRDLLYQTVRGKEGIVFLGYEMRNVLIKQHKCVTFNSIHSYSIYLTQ